MRRAPGYGAFVSGSPIAAPKIVGMVTWAGSQLSVLARN